MITRSLIVLVSLLTLACGQATSSADDGGFRLSAAGVFVDGGCSCREESREPQVQLTLEWTADDDVTGAIQIVAVRAHPVDHPDDAVELRSPSDARPVTASYDLVAGQVWILDYPRDAWPYTSPGIGNTRVPDGWDWQQREWVMDVEVLFIDASGRRTPLRFETPAFDVDGGALG